METRELVDQQQYLTFFLAGEEYAITILKVKEIVEYHTVTTVPKTPRWIRGVINLRGAVVPVVDMAIKFGVEERPVTKTTCIIITEEQSATIGIIADAVSRVLELPASEIHEPPSFGTGVRVDYLLGMLPLGTKFALLLDIDKVLSTDELATLNEATESAAAEEAGVETDEVMEQIETASPAPELPGQHDAADQRTADITHKQNGAI